MQTHVASVVVRTAASYRYPYSQSVLLSMHGFTQDVAETESSRMALTAFINHWLSALHGRVGVVELCGVYPEKWEKTVGVGTE